MLPDELRVLLDELRVLLDEREEEVLWLRAGAASRLTVVVRPFASVVLIVVRVVPLLLTRVSTVVEAGWRCCEDDELDALLLVVPDWRVETPEPAEVLPVEPDWRVCVWVWVEAGWRCCEDDELDVLLLVVPD